MNKTQLVEALAARIGDRRTAAIAVDGLLQTIVDTVGAGESVSLTGFGVFESRARAARVARNPRTGETVEVPATTVPAFRPGAGFRKKVSGSAAPAPRTAPVRRPRATPAVAAPVAEPAPAKPARKSARAKGGAGFAAAEAPVPAKAAPTKAAPTKAAPTKAVAAKVVKAKAAKEKPVEDKAKKVRAKK